jgi:hypothetical protein
MLASNTTKYRRHPRHAGADAALRLDGRTQTAKRYRARFDEFAAEIGAPLSGPDRVLVGHAVALALRLETMQADLVAGKIVDNDELSRLSAESRQAFDALTARSRRAR